MKYILSEHKTLNVQRELRTIDPRIILVNHFDNDDETLTLRLAGGNADMFSYLWENFSQLYNEKHMLTLLRYFDYAGYELTA